MTSFQPPFDAQAQHWLDIRVYYEDTDFTGMVYHANYLRFFERGRSDFLRAVGIMHQTLLDRPDPAAFTLTNINVDYKAPARVDDLIRIRSRFLGAKGARVTFQQTCLRGETVLAEAMVSAVMIHLDGRPRRPVREVAETMVPYIYKAEL